MNNVVFALLFTRVMQAMALRRLAGRLLPAIAMAVALAATTLAGCSQESGTPTLTWFINPDNGGRNSSRRSARPSPAARIRCRSRPCPTTPQPSASSWCADSQPRIHPSTS